MKKIRVAIRYCGGCNPDYDRTGLVAEIKQTLDYRCTFDDNVGPADWILMINGCPTACASMENLPLDRCVTIRRPADASLFIEGIRTDDESRFEPLRCRP
ncbi:hypothetical protein [uncultured Desulfosarcina sp.]|uniref:hypothetical protein n=1 Tax=uncultured Desulfosarcina sp. TaxID=218289 RepID=UPI0029C8DC8D|nr:hypothetical protein [uncultured Desulfosarcina sp.]